MLNLTSEEEETQDEEAEGTQTKKVSTRKIIESVLITCSAKPLLSLEQIDNYLINKYLVLILIFIFISESETMNILSHIPP